MDLFFNPLTVTPPLFEKLESALFKVKLLEFMNAFEYRPKVGLFLKKTISRLLQKWNHFEKWK